jgi:apolipoprotein N-acyltransferase
MESALQTPHISPKILKEVSLILSAVLVGLLSSLPGSSDKWIGLWGILPLLWNESVSRKNAFFVSLSFYLAVSRGIVPGSYVFFQDGSVVRAFLLWASSAVALSCPFAIFWTGKDAAALPKTLKALLCLSVSIFPPLGIICWAHPLSAAGLFFSGLRWRGLTLMLGLCIAGNFDRRINRLVMLLFLVLLFLRDFPADIKMTGLDVRPINASFGRIASGSGDFDAQFERERIVFQFIRQLNREGAIASADVVVLPETLIGRMYATTRKRWERFFSSWTGAGTIFLAGAEIPTDRGRKYDNVMIAFDGSEALQMAKQRIPVPYSMYRPFHGTGANGALTSFGDISTLRIKGKKYGVLICYEQFLVWPFLTLLSQKPDAIIGASNMWWSRNTSLPCIQQRTIHAWTALFRIPLFTSKNE